MIDRVHRENEQLETKLNPRTINDFAVYTKTTC